MPRGHGWTARKKSRPQDLNASDMSEAPGGGSPSEDEWRTWRAYNSFTMEPEPDVRVKFRKGDFALLAPQGFRESTPTWQYYVAQILEIRGKSASEVWARIRWFYAASDKELNLDASCYGKFERFSSEHIAFEHASTFERVVTVVHFDETSVESPPMTKRTFFYRHAFDHHEGRVQHAQVPLCMCGLPFNPDLETDIMHFCPRPQCRRAYHVRCLHDLSKAAKESNHHLPLNAYLESSPDFPGRLALHPPAVIPDVDIDLRPRKRRRVRFSDQVGHLKQKPSSEELRAPSGISACETPVLPADLLRIARCPIVRGEGVGGPSGNVRAVVAARRLVYDATVSGTPPRDWQKHVDIEHALDVADCIESLQGGDPVPFSCPNCAGAV